MGVELDSKSFDLIVCVGVLAHVDSPVAVIEKVAQLARPGGSVIMEFTDSFHLWSVPIVLYQNLLKLLRPQPYRLNRLSRRQLSGCVTKIVFENPRYIDMGFPRSVSLKWPGKKRCIG